MRQRSSGVTEMAARFLLVNNASYLAPFASYHAVFFIKFLPFAWEYLSLTHSLSVMSENVTTSHILPKTRFFLLRFWHVL